MTKSIALSQLPTPPTLLDIQKAFSKAGTDQHLRFSDKKGLHTHARFAGSSLDFRAKFGDTAALRQRAQMRDEAAIKIIHAVKDAYGQEIARRVFEDPEIRKNIVNDGGITKSTLDMLVSRAEAGKDPFKNVAANLPAGVSVDAQGNLSGMHLIDKMPAGMSHAGDPMNVALAKISEGVMKVEDRPPIAGYVVPTSVRADWPRTDIRIQHPDGTEVSLTAAANHPEGSDERKRGLEQAVQTLNDFAGSEKAMLVLASMLRQGPVKAGLTCLTTSDQKLVSETLVPVSGHCTLLNRDGTMTKLNAKQVNGAPIVLSKLPNGDFKITMEARQYLRARPGHENKLPLHKDGVIEAHTKATFIVKGGAAADGGFAIETEGFRVQINGKLSPPGAPALS